ncbi:internalin [Listeria monocytogenes]|nr:internalin [Listeria monocytogenes]EAC7583245.1 internalin [Listeria monocytogenes]EAC7585069.1 internalin [Listeria monocytogenes]EAE1319926.1 internalin [Listeria monocytogenes]EAE1408073.1 internalin [Listeria monocytogenes]
MKDKKYLQQLFVALTIIIGINVWIGSSGETEVKAANITQPTPINQVFPDANLAEVIQRILQKPNVSAPVTQDELNSVEIINANSGIFDNIASIEGVQYLNNLTELQLVGRDNSISDLHPLSGLIHLKDIDLSDNKISDLSPLSNLSNLNKLNFTRNQIKDLSQLSGLINLTSLNLSNNQVSDITPLSDLIKLTSLHMSSNKISDISPLSHLTNLTTLAMSKNQINDLSALSGLVSLVSLEVTKNQINDLTPLSDLTNLSTLSISENKISSIGPLSGLTKLTILSVEVNKISDINPLSDLTNLTTLIMAENEISDINSLSGLNNLWLLDVRSNQINDISSFNSSKNLSFLWASDQTIVNKPVNYQQNLVLQNNIIDRTGTLVSPNGISDNGSYTSPHIIWGLPDYKKQVSYTFDNGDEYLQLSGTVVQPLIEVPVSYKVLFDVDGAETSETVAKDTLLTPPANPVKEGYAFTGWYDEKTGGTEWDFATDKMPAKDITLYAQFSEKPYTATLDVDGKTTSQTVAYQHLVQAPTDPMKEGYTFIGWYDEKTGGTEWDFATDKMPAKDITLYAQFSEKPYTATLDVEGKTTSQTVAYQHLVQAPTDPMKEGYTFIGWYDEKTGGTEWDFATDKMPAKDITLYAQFSKNSSDEGTPGEKGQDEGAGGKDGTTDKPTESDLQPVDKPTNNSPQLKDTQSTLSVKAKHVSGSKEQGAKEKSSLPATGDHSSFTLYLQAIGVLFLVTFFWISHKRKKVRNEK